MVEKWHRYFLCWVQTPFNTKTGFGNMVFFSKLVRNTLKDKACDLSFVILICFCGEKSLNNTRNDKGLMMKCPKVEQTST